MLNRVKIWEAARATSTATSFFNPVNIGTEGFVDGVAGANNPINELWTEAYDIWNDGTERTGIWTIASAPWSPLAGRTYAQGVPGESH